MAPGQPRLWLPGLFVLPEKKGGAGRQADFESRLGEWSFREGGVSERTGKTVCGGVLNGMPMPTEK